MGRMDMLPPERRGDPPWRGTGTMRSERMSSEQAHEEHFTARWADLDANRHLRNTLFSEFATHTRFRLLEARGFPQARFEALRFGPVMFREEIRYRRELVFGDEATVSVIAAGLSEDGSQWRVHQEVVRADGKQAAILRIDGAWIHLDSRRLIAPPAELIELLQRLPRTEDFEVLRSVLRPPT
jgi:acyl-CoA thioester hydrolase